MKLTGLDLTVDHKVNLFTSNFPCYFHTIKHLKLFQLKNEDSPAALEMWLNRIKLLLLFLISCENTVQIVLRLPQLLICSRIRFNVVQSEVYGGYYFQGC